MNLSEKKFRAFYDGMMVYDAARVGNALYWDDGRMFDAFAFKQKNPAVLLQVIGYRDMAANEIYEGDVLRDNFDRTLLVEWWRGGFTFKAITKTNFERASIINQWFEFDMVLPTIIGNIFENPELVAGGGV